MTYKQKRQAKIKPDNLNELLDIISEIFVNDLMQLPEDQRIQIVSPVQGRLYDSFKDRKVQIAYTPEVLTLVFALWRHVALQSNVIEKILNDFLKEYRSYPDIQARDKEIMQ